MQGIEHRQLSSAGSRLFRRLFASDLEQSKPQSGNGG
jgi:hypothetical protein